VLIPSKFLFFQLLYGYQNKSKRVIRYNNFDFETKEPGLASFLIESMNLPLLTRRILTSDHGEFLGAHSMLRKLALLEKSARVPLIMSFPGRIPQGATVHNFVSQLDVHAAILDYMGAPDIVLNYSDGKSLRRFVEERSFNEEYDENFVVVESDDSKRARR
jgi:Sulfatase